MQLNVNYAGAQPRLKSWGGPKFGSQHRGAWPRTQPFPHPPKGRAGCWVREGREGVAPSHCWGSGGITPGKKFWKLRC